jgi:hypothetical protein
MGHDVIGFKQAPTEENEKTNNRIASLRRGAFNELAREIYLALECVDMDCGVSGCGGYLEFSHDQLKAAHDRLAEHLQPERDFLAALIDYTKDGKPCFIAFW